MENDTRARLLAAANESFRRGGYNGTSLKDVVAAASATVGSLYHFFPGGKEELTAAVLRESGAAYGELFELIANASADPATAIGDFFDGAAAVIEATDYIDPCPIGTVAREIANTNDNLRVIANDVFRAWSVAASSRFQAAGMDSSQADELATTVVAALEGGFVLARTARDADILRRMGRQMQRLTELALSTIN